MVTFHQIAAALYLAAGVGGLLGIVLPAPRIARGAAVGLALGVVVHAVALASLHGPPAVPLTELPAALSLVAWVGNIFLLGLLWRLRINGLTAVVGPVSFVAVFFAALRLPHLNDPGLGGGSIPHAHVLLGSTGLALLGLAGMAGLFFLIEHRRLKRKRHLGGRLRLPSLEALDRVNRAALAVGFPVLSLGVVTGMLWLRSTRGVVWTGTAHEIWCVVAWGIYAGLVLARFASDQGSRQAAASALAGSAFLVFAVVGVGFLT
ncbi:MAG: cytochrome C assembly family protein [Myxococcota bacterium]